MKRKGITIGLFTVLFAMVLTVGSSITRADPPMGGVPQLLSEILAEIGNITGQLGEIGSDARIEDADSTESLVTNPSDGSEHNLVSLTGPGTFVAARMTKQGGASGLTAVSLEMDGKIVVQRNIAALKNWGMTQNNPFGVVVVTGPGGIDAVTIGFPQPIAFESNLTLKAIVGEAGVVQIIGTVIHGS